MLISGDRADQPPAGHGAVRVGVLLAGLAPPGPRLLHRQRPHAGAAPFQPCELLVATCRRPCSYLLTISVQ